VAEAQTWRIDTGDRVREVVVTSVHRGLWRCEDGPRETTPVAAVRAYAHFDGRGGMPVAPGELTRAELAARLATATASVQQLRADVELATAQRDAEACHRDDADAEAERVTRELAALRAQQAPLVACVDALRAAATAAGWRDADATGETLVAWVRRGEREACAVRCDAIYTERDDAARKRRKYGTQNTCDGDCARLAGQAQGAAMCVEAIREGGE
jgi:hypothetical protein